MSEKTQIISTPEGEISLASGKIAMLASGSVMVKKGGTVVFAAVTVDTSDTVQDFFPLTIDYLEKMYANGAISGSRMVKREGFPSERATLIARQVDHTIRPLFPETFTKAVNVVITLLAFDKENNPEELAVLAASTALMLSGVPFAGPAATTVIGVDQSDNLIFNPKLTEEHDFKGEFVVSATDTAILSIEGWGKEISEEVMDRIMDESMPRIQEINKVQKAFVEGIAKPAMEHKAELVAPEILAKVQEAGMDQIKAAVFQADKPARNAAIDQAKKDLKAKFASEDLAEEERIIEGDVNAAIEVIIAQIVRDGVLKENKRMSGRGLEEIRPLSAEVDLLPTVHGSALFTRGLTQSLSIVTLGSTNKSNIIDDMGGSEDIIKPFMHHYNMPGYTTGDMKRLAYKPGRREIGHGNIGENALKNMVPSQAEFPYTIRVVSEIMTSNGSTSMAATCASSMALMAAGVPMKEQVAGIGVGLMTDLANPSNYKLMLDIEGDEDHYGDMDFKVTGTKNGITAIQFETKLQGVVPEVLKQAFRLSQKGRMQVLEVMNAAISTPRTELAPSAPRVDMVTIPQDKIGELIGPGGKNIKALVEQANSMGDSEVEIDIQDSGLVTITSSNKAQRDFAVSRIQDVAMVPEIGKIYSGFIDKVMPYGAFVDVNNSISGLIHVSELADGFVKDPSEVVKEGQPVKVKLIKIENGKLSFSLKQAKE